ncbi:unnamed protein product [Brassica oleracea]
MECKGKVKTANEIFNLGISRNAKPVEKLNDAYKKFMVRTIRRSKSVDDKPIVRPAAASASSFEVFVDEEEDCTNQGVEKKKSETISSSSNILPLNDGREIKK